MIFKGPFLLRRMGSVRLLLLSVLLSTLIAAALVAALAGFAASSLPQAVSGDLARAPSTSVYVYGAFPAAQDRIDRPVVPAALHRAFGPVPFVLDNATWSDPIGLPAVSGQKVTSLVEAAAISRISDHARLVAGSWPAAPGSAPGSVVQAAVPAGVARALHLRIGQSLTLKDRQSGTVVRFRLTGLYQPVAAASQYWRLDLIAPSGISVESGTITYGPFVVSGAAFTSRALAVDGATWLATLGTTKIPAGELQPLSDRINHAALHLSGSTYLGGLQVTDTLSGVLSGVATKLVVARSLLLVSGLELLLLAGAALTLTVRTLATHRENEAALLSARGAGRWQMTRIALSEALVVTIVAAAAGALLGTWLAGLLARSGDLRAAGLSVSGIPGQVWWTVAIVVLVCTAILVWPALHPVDPGAARVRKGRQAVAAAAARAGADLALVALAVLAAWQLRDYSVLGRTSAGVGVDPVLALAPAVVLAAATVLPLRLLPVAARAVDRLAARTRRLGVAMPSWEISRRAARQSASMLLIVLAVGTGTLALAQHQSWRQSALDQSAFDAGADVRAVLPSPLPLGRAASVSRAPSVTSAMPVGTTVSSTIGQVLAIDPRTASRTLLMRADQSALPQAALWRRLEPQRSPGSVALPGRPARLEIIASLAPGSGPGIGPVDVSVSIQDAAGIVYSVPAGVLPADGRPHAVVAQLSGTRQAIYPLRLLSLSVQYTLPPPPHAQVQAAVSRIATLKVSGLAVSASPTGAFGHPFAAGTALARWQPSISAPGLAVSAVGVKPRFGPLEGSLPPGIASIYPGYGHTVGGIPPHVIYGPVTGLLTLTAPVPFHAAYGIATTAFLSASQLHVGNFLQVAAGPTTLTVQIVGSVASFPTVTGSGGALIIDGAAAQDLVAEQGGAPLPVTQWWLATRTGGPPRGLPAGTIVTDREQIHAALLSEPMSAIAQQAVQAVAVAAALLAVLGFTVSIAGSVRERRSQSALLSALGVDSAARARLLCVEAIALGVPAAATGLLLGTLLAHLLVPAVTLTPAGAPPVPSALVEVPLGIAALLALVICAIPVIASAATAAYRPDAAAQLRASEAM
jgi:hypothetical protein